MDSLAGSTESHSAHHRVLLPDISETVVQTGHHGDTRQRPHAYSFAFHLRHVLFEEVAAELAISLVLTARACYMGLLIKRWWCREEENILPNYCSCSTQARFAHFAV
jgi:hypothetical protein